MRLDLFGKLVEVTKERGQWNTYYLGNEGKKRLAQDISIPDNLSEAEIVQYLSDLCHEWATPKNFEVTVIKNKNDNKGTKL